MAETANRREAVRAIINEVRDDTMAFRDSLRDPAMKELLTRIIIDTLDTAEGMLSLDFGDQAMAITYAQGFAEQARDHLEEFKQVVETYGGPDNVRTIG